MSLWLSYPLQECTVRTSGSWKLVQQHSQRGYQKTIVSGTVLKYPAFGYRSNNTGNISSSSYGYYWYSTSSGSGNAFKFSDGNPVANTSIARASVAAVRCQKNATGASRSISFTYSASAGSVFWSPMALGDGYPEAHVKWSFESAPEVIGIGTCKSHTYYEAGNYEVTFDTNNASELTLYSLDGISNLDLSSF